MLAWLRCNKLMYFHFHSIFTLTVVHFGHFRMRHLRILFPFFLLSSFNAELIRYHFSISLSPFQFTVPHESNSVCLNLIIYCTFHLNLLMLILYHFSSQLTVPDGPIDGLSSGRAGTRTATSRRPEGSAAVARASRRGARRRARV